jgi:hypothetical protein
MMMDRCSLAMKYQPSKSCGHSWDTSRPCTAPSTSIASLTIADNYASLNAALRVLAEIRQRLGEDAKLRFNLDKVKIYIPGVTRERARELVLRNINNDPSLASLRELYDLDLAKPDLGIIKVTNSLMISCLFVTT